MPQPNEKDLGDLAQTLAALSPAPARLERDRVLFQAGRASKRQGWAWPAATALLTLTSACLSLVLVSRPMPERIITIVKETKIFVPLSATGSDASPAAQEITPPLAAQLPSSTLSYWSLEQQALRFGVEGLPSNAAEGAENAAGSAAPHVDLSVGAQLKKINQQSFSSGEP